jgi:hypothetical protein
MPDGSPIKRFDWQLDGYKFSYNSTPIHEPVIPIIPGFSQKNMLGMGSVFGQSPAAGQPYWRSIFSQENANSLPSRIQVLIAYNQIQLYSINVNIANIESGYDVRGWVEWYDDTIS